MEMALKWRKIGKEVGVEEAEFSGTWRREYQKKMMEDLEQNYYQENWLFLTLFISFLYGRFLYSL
jgi:ABC-type nickel/cobalt efflux system permease component RcnA